MPEHPELPEFQRHQYALTAHIRDPERHPAPAGIEDRRLAIYRELLFNNVSQLLARTFQVLRKLHSDDAWAQLMRAYFATHQAHTPLFLEMPQEFLKYLQEERGEVAGDPPFLLELAHYEWVELAVQIDESSINLDHVDKNGDLLSGRPAVSPVAWPLAYTFPVHRISPDFRPDPPSPNPTFLVVYRGRDEKGRFLEINAVTARLLELLEENDQLSGRDVLQMIATEMPQLPEEAVISGGTDALLALRAKDIVLGTRTD